MKKKIFVTGSNGLLGQKLIYALLNRSDFEIFATSKGENRLMKKDGYTYQSLDITDKSAVENLFKLYLPDVVVNTAAMTNVDACETQRDECWKINVTAVKNIIDASEKIKARKQVHLIHLSTDFVFDGKNGPYKEEDKPNPLSYYALSKNESEKIVQDSHIKWAILRTIIIYGVVDNMSRSNLVLWAKDALSKGQKINVVDDQFRSPTLAEDLADACIRVTERGAEGIYHISGKETMSILEIVYKVADFFKLDKLLVNPVKSNTLNQPAKRPPTTGFIIDKAIRDLGYHPHSFEEGLKVVAEQLSKIKK